MAILVTALFKGRSTAKNAVEELVARGWSRDDISLLMSEATRGREFGFALTSKAPEIAALGGIIGGIIGAIAAGLVATGAIAIPGLALIAAGPIVAVLAGLGAGLVAGGVTGALIGKSIPEHEARFYDEQIEHGGILVSVYTDDDRAKQSRRVLEAAGADKVK
jgi:hypothetical protein